MRTLKFFITGILCLSFTINTLFAQNLHTKISIKVENATLPQVLQQLQKKYGYRFSYLNNELPAKTRFTAEIKNKSFSEVLDVLLEKTDLGYKQSNGQIIIKKGFPKNKPKTTTFQQVSAPKTVAKTTIKPAETKPESPAKNIAAAETPKPEAAETKEHPKAKSETPAIARVAEEAPQNAMLPAAKTALPADENVYDTLTVFKMEGKKVTWLDKLAALRLQNEKAAENSDTVLTRNYHVGFVPPLSTNGTQANKYVNNISAHAILGTAAGLEGLEISGFGNVEKSYVSGLQYAGFFNITRNSPELYYLAEERNESYTLNGGQFAGFFNLANGNVKGAQFAGYMNIADGHMKGAQFAGFLNISKNVHGVQGAGYMNLAKNVEGAQLAGFLNIADTVSGLQASGFLNVAKVVQGTQISVINIADSVSGVPIGLFNFVKKGGYKRAEFYIADDFDANFTYKIGVQRFYTLAGLSAELNDKKRWAYSIGLGAEWPVAKHFRINTDLVAYNVIEESFEKFPKGILEADELNLLNKFRLLATLQITNRLALFGGPVYNVFVSRYQEPELQEVGSQLVTKTFYDHTSAGGTNVKMWIGFNAGVRF
ncbi:DUF4974 domain-containing protein [Adhaeribacter sp. BT258]|uniref:DUF4974 domain-containing protein n=1 Tax=Adhaeribacter terrigena TaxID=2793070 RepID=A0ABS1C3M8_9BACT|nr:FecR domain-containing protein [Adhaeribacter terrigena]MBK0404007.1 DUF4974 domain-containing protein [Adhaeribacter terrigena]